MGENNKAILKAFLKASENQDEVSMREFLDPEIEVVEAESLPYGGIHRGVDAFLQLIPKVFGTWRDCEVSIQNWVSEGDHVITLATMSGYGRSTDLPFKVPIAEVWTFRKGKIVRVMPYYFDTVMMCKAAGSS